MRRLFLRIIWISLLLTPQIAWGNDAVTASNGGWTVTADADQEVISVAHDTLGVILRAARLNLRSKGGILRLKGWSVRKTRENELSIGTSQPQTTWLFELSAAALKISSTTADGMLTAEAPAPADRIVARLLDPLGTPVNWMMTPETKQGYGGTEASRPSFLPRRNPEVMYFALGRVASPNLHSLFDRNTDAVIDFSEQTLMERNHQNSDVLDITIPVPGNTLVRFTPDYFTQVLGLPFYKRFDDTYFPQAPMVWDSWSSYYDQVHENDIVRNTDWIAANLKAYGYQYVQLDDGYDRGERGTHYWIDTWDKEKFPHGPKWLTDYIKSKGLKAGVWLVPNASQVAVEEHPDWYLRYKKDGTIVRDYSTPTLDSTNPEVLEFLKKEFTILDAWGFDYYKFDGEHDFLKYVPGVDLDRIADKAIDPIVAYRNRLKVIRDTVGPTRFIEGCPAGTPLDGIGYFNSYYTGEDPYNSWLGMYVVFSSLNANAFLNHLAVYVMPGEMDVAPPVSVAEAEKRWVSQVVATARTRENTLAGFGTTPAEARTVLSFVALSGSVYSLGSLVADLPPERTKLLKMTLPTMPILPIDLFSRGTDMPMWDIFKHTTDDEYIHNYPEILDLKVNAPSGVYDVVGLTNWRSRPATRTLSFAEKLGLSPDSPYVVFDYWGQKILGTYKDRIEVAIDPHDTRVLLIHPALHRPQLVGSSRHITGAYSIKDLAWHSSKNLLHGVSNTVAGDDYTLWISVPKLMSISAIRARTHAGSEISAQYELTANGLRVTFKGQPAPVDWEVAFRDHSGK